jgi:hypothetical protein
LRNAQSLALATSGRSPGLRREVQIPTKVPASRLPTRSRRENRECEDERLWHDPQWPLPTTVHCSNAVAEHEPAIAQNVARTAAAAMPRGLLCVTCHRLRIRRDRRQEEHQRAANAYNNTNRYCKGERRRDIRNTTHGSQQTQTGQGVPCKVNARENANHADDAGHEHRNRETPRLAGNKRRHDSNCQEGQIQKQQSRRVGASAHHLLPIRAKTHHPKLEHWPLADDRRSLPRAAANSSRTKSGRIVGGIVAPRCVEPLPADLPKRMSLPVKRGDSLRAPRPVNGEPDKPIMRDLSGNSLPPHELWDDRPDAPVEFLNDHSPDLWAKRSSDGHNSRLTRAPLTIGHHDQDPAMWTWCRALTASLPVNHRTRPHNAHLETNAGTFVTGFHIPLSRTDVTMRD